MATVSKFASVHTAITGGYTDPSNGFADDGVYATAAPVKNAEISAYWGFPAFSTADIPDGATIDSVTAEIEFKVSTTASVAEQFLQLFVVTTAQGTEQSDTTEPTTDTLLQHQVTTGVTLADLRTADTVRGRTRSRRGNSNTAVTFSLDYAKLTVVYSTVQTFEQALPATSTVAAEMADQLTFLRAMDATSVVTAAMAQVRSYSQALAVAVTAAAALVAQVTGKALAALSTIGAAISRVVSYARVLAVSVAVAVGLETEADVGDAERRGFPSVWEAMRRCMRYFGW